MGLLYMGLNLLHMLTFTCHMLAEHQPFYVSICISTLPMQHTFKEEKKGGKTKKKPNKVKLMFKVLNNTGSQSLTDLFTNGK